MRNYKTTFKTALSTWLKAATSNTAGTTPDYFKINKRKVETVYSFIKDGRHHADMMPLIEYECSFQRGINASGCEDITIDIDMIVWMAGNANPENFTTLDNVIEDIKTSLQEADLRTFGTCAEDITFTEDSTEYVIDYCCGKGIKITLSGTNAI